MQLLVWPAIDFVSMDQEEYPLVAEPRWAAVSWRSQTERREKAYNQASSDNGKPLSRDSGGEDVEPRRKHLTAWTTIDIESRAPHESLSAHAAAPRVSRRTSPKQRQASKRYKRENVLWTCCKASLDDVTAVGWDDATSTVYWMQMQWENTCLWRPDTRFVW